jgi:hypothetical protein
MPNLKKSITKYARKNAYVRIGVTGKPERRWREHKKYEPAWDRMVVIYETSSVKNVRLIESELISYNWEHDNLWNFTGGGGGPLNEKPPYYLYILVQKSE